MVVKKSTRCRGSGQEVHDVFGNSWNACPNRDEACIRAFTIQQLIRKDGQYLAPPHELRQQKRKRNSSLVLRKQTRRTRTSREHRRGSSRRR